MTQPSMSPERWAAVKRLFHAALDLDPASRDRFLAHSTVSDPLLRQEVESLIAAHDEETGQRIDHYLILGKLGEGGMGEVYLARDERLGREVALKILAERLAAEPAAAHWFTREARAVSALDHQNICRLFDVGEWLGKPYFTMERLKGQTLRERLHQGSIEVPEARRITLEVLEALAAAHERGILHCDIKPANLFLTGNGQVKVMDFGIARKVHRRIGPGPMSTTWTASEDPGPVGTPHYMSPEQARDDELDGRTDLFSLGAVMYEMATGRKAFPGETYLQILNAVWARDPEPLSGVDASFTAVIRKALSKDRDQRFASAAAMAQALRSPLPSPGRRWLFAAVACGLLVLAGLSGWLLREGSRGSSGPATVRPVVSLPGRQDAPALSPRGDQVAFSWINPRDGNEDIYVRMIDSGPPHRVTTSAAQESMPVWSPDGQRLAFRRIGGGDNGYYVIAALGGPERLVAPLFNPPVYAGGAGFTWTPDGSRLVIADRPKASGSLSLISVGVEAGETRTLVAGPEFAGMPVFSADGRWLAYLAGPSFLAHDLHVRPAAGGPARRLTRDARWIAGIAWHPSGKQIVFSSSRTGLFRLWRIPLEGGTPAPVAETGPDAISPSFSHSGTRLAFLHQQTNINLWRVPMNAKGDGAEIIAASTRVTTQPDFSPDGSRIVFASDRSGTWEIWTSAADGSAPLQLTRMNGPQTGSPRWSPDGKWIAFDSRIESHADVFVIGAQGEQMRRLTTDSSDEFIPFWSRDSRFVYFRSSRTGSLLLYRIPAAGGAVEQVTQTSVLEAFESLDGRHLYIVRRGKAWRMPAASRHEEGIEEVAPSVFWRDCALAGDRLVFARTDAGGIQRIEEQPLSGGPSRPLFKIGPRPRRMGPLVVSPDGKYLLFDRLDHQASEILLIDGFR